MRWCPSAEHFPDPCLSICLLSPSRAGSVCLDVINQTWSPMFGELPVCTVLAISADASGTPAKCPTFDFDWASTTPPCCLSSPALQISSTCLRSSSRSCCCTRTLQTH